MVHARYECVARPEPTRSKSSRAETLLMEVVSRPRVVATYSAERVGIFAEHHIAGAGMDEPQIPAL